MDGYPSRNMAAEDIGISAGALSRLLSGKRTGGSKSIEAIVSYCKKKGLNVGDYIFLG